MRHEMPAKPIGHLHSAIQRNEQDWVIMLNQLDESKKLV
jgi:hypothetical protein